MKKISLLWTLRFLLIGFSLISIFLGDLFEIFFLAALVFDIWYHWDDIYSTRPEWGSVVLGLGLAAALVWVVLLAAEPGSGQQALGDVMGLQWDKADSISVRLYSDDELIGGFIGDEDARALAEVLYNLKIKSISSGEVGENSFSISGTVDGHGINWYFFMSPDGIIEYEGDYYTVVDEDFSFDDICAHFYGHWDEGPVSLFFPALSQSDFIALTETGGGEEHRLEGGEASEAVQWLSGIGIYLDPSVKIDPYIVKYSVDFNGGRAELTQNYIYIYRPGQEPVACRPRGQYDIEAFAGMFR